MPKFQFAKALLGWYDLHGRKHLPWQKKISAYRVWLSEIMLQQTQVETVIPYFQRFLRHFPNVKALAQAPEDEVLHLWTGLGYYARARNLHRCAITVSTRYAGRFPRDVAQLAQLPGIGRSTAAAIASIAFEAPEAILDGNVKRVLARFHAVPGWPGLPAVEKTLWAHAEGHVPRSRNRDYTQAIMDLGATLCTRSKPSCHACPLNGHCLAHARGEEHLYPGKKEKKAKPERSRVFLALMNSNNEILLEKRPAQGIWGGLWSLPEYDPDEDIRGEVERRFGKLRSLSQLAPMRHEFSHYSLVIHPHLAKLGKVAHSAMEADKQLWYTPDQGLRLGLAAPVVKLLGELYA